eukprot:CAMPEP_0179143478 /NCGR_PEP_ID=MMETSP0796-20121207/69025_1 /TAXON_ID=73915 /ORGANISM="Pyrodinium bahamense, Strain pbaha01" /LENGTH=40 /DNA_ID= /DNA_START= /DNA_END= /DNA_ORIENTATION=
MTTSYETPAHTLDHQQLHGSRALPSRPGPRDGAAAPAEQR